MCYEKTKKKVVPRIASESFFNFTTDETSNIRKERVQNFCVVIPQKGAYYICSEIVNNAGTSIGGKWTAEWTLEKMEDVAGPDGFDCINSVGTDTCNTMRDSWNKMERNHRTKHVLFVPCDSHGLQLLMKDIIETNWFSSCFSPAQNIVTHFNHSPK